MENKEVDGKKKCWKRSSPGGNQRVFEHIKKLIRSEDDINQAIGTRYILEDAARPFFGLPGNPKNMLVCKQNDSIAYEYFINRIDLYIFETKVGFLAFDIGYDIRNAAIEEIIDSNYCLKNIMQNRESISYRKHLNKTEVKDIPVHMGDIIKELLAEVDVCTFFEDENGLPKQAIVYNAVCLNDTDPDDKFLKAYLYRMRRLFKESYKPSKIEYEIEENEEILQLFENSYWGASLEGAANLFHLADDEDTNKFFKENYKGQIESTYLYIYIIALHQRYALLHYSIIASDLKRISSINKDRKSKELIEEIKREKLEIAYFKLRCAFKNLSSITHQNKLYQMLRNILNINDLSEEIDSELQGLSAILETEKEKEIERRKSFFNAVIAVVTTIFVIVQTVNAIWDMFNKYGAGNYPEVGTNEFILLLSSSAILSIGALAGMFYFIYKWIKAERNK